MAWASPTTSIRKSSIMSLTSESSHLIPLVHHHSTVGRERLALAGQGGPPRCPKWCGAVKFPPPSARFGPPRGVPGTALRDPEPRFALSSSGLTPPALRREESVRRLVLFGDLLCKFFLFRLALFGLSPCSQRPPYQLDLNDSASLRECSVQKKASHFRP